MDFSQYRLNETKELSDLAKQMGNRFDPFFNAVYKLIDELGEGKSFDIEANVHPENRELFIKCACFYILDRNRTRKTFDAWVEFTNDYKHIRKMKSCYPTVFHKKRKHPQSTTV